MATVDTSCGKIRGDCEGRIHVFRGIPYAEPLIGPARWLPPAARHPWIGVRDARRGETVKALVVLKPEYKGKVSEQEIISWSHDHMAAYKSPRIVEFVESLPKSGSGKVQWRELQEQEAARQAAQA